MSHEKLLIGRTEWASLPDIDIPAIKAKIDTGARTSALHAFDIQQYAHHGRDFVRFKIHPLQRNDKVILQCHAPVVDNRFIMSSNGQKEHRIVIITTLQLGDQRWPIEVTLSNRDPLKHRMLLGREALNHRVIIDPGVTCKQGKFLTQALRELYS